MKTNILNPNMPSSMERGWSEFVDKTRAPNKIVRQWITDYSNSSGEIISYVLRYEYPEGKEENLIDLKITALHFKSDQVQNFKTNSDQLHKQYKEQEKQEIALRGKDSVKEDLKLYLTEKVPSYDLTEVTIPPSGERIYVKKMPVITSSDIASVETNEVEDGYEYWLKLNAEGAKKMHAATMKSLGKRMAFYYNDEFCSAPIIREAIDSGALVTFRPKTSTSQKRLSPSH